MWWDIKNLFLYIIKKEKQTKKPNKHNTQLNMLKPGLYPGLYAQS